MVPYLKGHVARIQESEFLERYCLEHNYKMLLYEVAQISLYL